MRARSSFLVLLVSCAGETEVQKFNTEPEARISSPEDRSVFEEGETILFTGQVLDEQDDPSTLRVTWTSDLDPDFEETSVPDSAGNVELATSLLAPGDHTITLRVEDSAGTSGTDFVAISVQDLEEAPLIAFLHPISGEYGFEGEPFSFEVEAADAQDAPEALTVAVYSSVDGDVCRVALDAEGVGGCDAVLSVGAHTLTAVVTDTAGNTGGAKALFEVVADADLDQDGDGWTPRQGDCDDADKAVNPDAVEVDNDVDDDCDGTADEDTEAWDDDGDCACEADACDGTVDESCVELVGGDCDDADDTAYPGAAEVCDGVDDDCDGTVDEGTACYDDDGDGYTEGDLDCDDAAADSHPGAPESADGRDNDCDGTVDEGTVAYDDDGDCACETDPCLGSIDAACAALTGGDCDDADPLRSPTADERCNGIDDDCDGVTDEDDAIDAGTWHRDGDADGYGDPAVTTAACSLPAGYVANAGDCDDTRDHVSPADPEICDGLDDDCDGAIDEAGALDETLWYPDVDTDGFGDPAVPTSACDAPAGYVADDTDCDDRAATVYPGADEYCNEDDDDCDGVTDEDDALDAPTWFVDGDGDGWGSTAGTAVACSVPEGYAGTSSDCADADASIHPTAAEVCDGVDQDCDGTADDGVLSTWYYDADGDGYGDPARPSVGCIPPSGYVASDEDCDDGDPSLSPETVWYRDSDRDGYGVAAYTRVQCEEPYGYSALLEDCDDTRALVNPAANESCDGRDNDCDGTTDEPAATGCTTYYYDADGDGYGTTTSACLCSPTGAYTASTNNDCYDGNASAYPGASTYQTSARGDRSYDYNCDGTETHRYTSEGYCNEVETCVLGICVTTSCDGASGWVSSEPDCGTTAVYTVGCDYVIADGSGVAYCNETRTSYTQSCR